MGTYELKRKRIQELEIWAWRAWPGKIVRKQTLWVSRDWNMEKVYRVTAWGKEHNSQEKMESHRITWIRAPWSKGPQIPAVRSHFELFLIPFSWSSVPHSCSLCPFAMMPNCLSVLEETVSVLTKIPFLVHKVAITWRRVRVLHFLPNETFEMFFKAVARWPWELWSFIRKHREECSLWGHLVSLKVTLLRQAGIHLQCGCALLKQNGNSGFTTIDDYLVTFNNLPFICFITKRVYC